MMRASPFFSRQYFWNGAGGLVVALLVAIGFIELVFPHHFIDGTHAYWQAQTEDITQYQIGLRAFIYEPWRLPLLRIESLNWPTGTLATFSDIIPLYALVLKTLSPLIALPHNPFGYWMGLCLLLQAVGAWWCLRAARINDGVALICLTFFLLMFPAWLSRMGHISLLSQWLIVFAIALCIQGRSLRKTVLFSWLLLVMISSQINVYLCAMICTLGIAQAIAQANQIITHAAIKSNAWMARVKLKQLALQSIYIACAIMLMGVVTALLVWPLPPANGAPDGGFGLYSANLLALISGTPQNWLHFSFASPEQAFEGFNYLGAGGIFLMLIAFIRLLKPPYQRAALPRANQGLLHLAQPNFAQPHECALPISIPVVCALLLMGVYALSNQIYLGKTLLYQWSAPAQIAWLVEPITGQFRASGRFLWPLAYAILIIGTIIVMRRFSRTSARTILITALVIQGIDLWPQMTTLRQIDAKEDAQVINFASWDQALPKHLEHLYFFPKMRCATHSDLYRTLLPVANYASQQHLTLNTAYLARYNPTCHEEAKEIASSNPSASAYVFTQQDYALEQVNAYFPNSWGIECHALDFAWVCASKQAVINSKQ